MAEALLDMEDAETWTHEAGVSNLKNVCLEGIDW